MNKFDPKELPKIPPGSPVWETVEAWATFNLQALRNQREAEFADIRKLDVSLGGIIAMKMLLDLPEIIKKEHDRVPLQDDSFGIPGLDIN